MKKKLLPWLLLGVAAAALILVLCVSLVRVNGHIYPRNIRSLSLANAEVADFAELTKLPNLESIDLRGTGLDIAGYEALAAAMPGCEIIWDVPFQGGYLPLNTTALIVTSLRAEDLEALDYLTELRQVDGTACTDYETLMALQARRPACAVRYTVELSGTAWPEDADELRLREPDCALLAQMLPYLPGVRSVVFSGTPAQPEALTGLLADYPQISFSCEMPWGTMPLSLDTTFLKLADYPLDAAQAAVLLAYHPWLEEADLLDCAFTQAELKALTEQFPEVFLLWELELLGQVYRTDVAEIDLTWKPIADVAVVEDCLPYLPKLEKVIMCNCGPDNETMYALNNRHPEVKFVWSFWCGSVPMRSDATYFAPVKYRRSVTNRDMANLKYCPDIIVVDVGHMELTNCEWVQYMPKLKYLIIGDTPIADISPLAGLQELIFLEMFETKVTDYSPLLQCPALEDLNLGSTHGDIAPVKEMTWLKRLWWVNQKSELMEQLVVALPNTQVFWKSYSDTGGGWRYGKHYEEQRDILGMGYFRT